MNEYPRWQGELRSTPTSVVIVGEEVRRGWYDQWARSAIILVGAYTILYLTTIYSQSQRLGDTVHTMDNFLYLINLLPWGALALAAIMGGPAFLEDSRQGALELYLSRAVSRVDYLTGKSVAVFGMAFLAIWLPSLLYWGASFLMFENHPDGWNWAPLAAAGHAFMWAVMATGLGLGLSCVARSSRAATLILLGGFAVMDVLISNLLESITRNDFMQLLSPFSAISEQREWLFNVDGEFEFPAMWGLVEWFALSVVGWGLVAWRHPRLRGVKA